MVPAHSHAGARSLPLTSIRQRKEATELCNVKSLVPPEGRPKMRFPTANSLLELLRAGIVRHRLPRYKPEMAFPRQPALCNPVHTNINGIDSCARVGQSGCDDSWRFYHESPPPRGGHAPITRRTI